MLLRHRKLVLSLIVLSVLTVATGFSFIYLFDSPVFKSSDNVSAHDIVRVFLYKHAEHNADLALVMSGWYPDCWLFCNGVNYTYTTQNLVTNVGHDFLNSKVHSSGYSNTSTVAQYIAWSTNTSTPAYTWGGSVTSYDNRCGGSLEVSTNGFSRALATTITLPATSGGTVTDTISKAFTASGSLTGVDMLCLETSATLTGSGAGTLYAVATVSSFNVISGDTVTGQWSITYT